MRALILGIMAIAFSAIGAEIVLVEPPRPDCIKDERSLQKWVEQTVHDAPPAGGIITMLHHRVPKYANYPQVGPIWIVTAVVLVQMPNSKPEYELDFCAYHVESNISDIEIAIGIPEEKLKEFMQL